MVGKLHIEIMSKKLKYSLEVQRKITIIRGDSGTGKTTLAKMIIRSRQEESPYKVKCQKECIAFTVDNFSKDVDLLRYRDAIIFIDEDVKFIKSKEFAEILKKSDCYFVLITREKLEMLPYSCKAIYELKNNMLISKENCIDN